jgi:maltose alpha-D-glucosyltransferase/alpha-amylase
MGDNYYLGDRDGVRTPMQWSADRNGGFSRTDPQRLYLPPIMDANYGYQAVNVEAQQRDASSLLNWMTRMIRVRKTHAAFGRGSLEFLYPRNRKVLAFIREHEGQKLLCVFNLARSAQAVELDLRAYSGSVPVEMTGNSAFPPIGELPYMLTLPAHGFYWFVLEAEGEHPRWHVPPTEVAPDFITLIAASGWQGIFSESQKSRLEREVLPDFMFRQRWFAAKDAHFARFQLTPLVMLEGPQAYSLTVCDALLPGGDMQRYFFPLSARWGSEHLRPGAPLLGFTLCRIRSGPRVGALLDATHEEQFVREFVRALREGLRLETELGELEFCPEPSLPPINAEAPIRTIGTEQSNVSLIVDEQVMLKIYRRLRPGAQPELEVARFLSEVGFQNTPRYLGAVEELSRDGERTALAIAFAFVPNQGDAWNAVVEALDRGLDDLMLVTEEGEEGTPTAEEPYVFPLDIAARLGSRTGELHRAFATPTSDPAFSAEKITSHDIREWAKAVQDEAEHVLLGLEQLRSGLSEEAEELVARLLRSRDAVSAKIHAIVESAAAVGLKTRIHGDYHLGQVLIAQDDVYIVDFEGEPARPLADRRMKTSPLRDIAGMLRSLDYAAWAALERFASRNRDVPERIAAAAAGWRRRASQDFLDAYYAVAPELKSPGGGPGLLELFLLQKVFYEIAYEAANRPAWLAIPVRGSLDLLSERQESRT